MNDGKDVGEPSKGKFSKFSEKLKESIGDMKVKFKIWEMQEEMGENIILLDL